MMLSVLVGAIVALWRVNVASARATAEAIEITSRSGKTWRRQWTDLVRIRRGMGVDTLAFADGDRVRLPRRRLHPVIKWQAQRLEAKTPSPRPAIIPGLVCFVTTQVCAVFAAYVTSKIPDVETHRGPVTVYFVFAALGVFMTIIVWFSRTSDAKRAAANRPRTHGALSRRG
jgi:hypothetical protein